jgi:hypothetical protein
MPIVYAYVLLQSASCDSAARYGAHCKCSSCGPCAMILVVCCIGCFIRLRLLAHLGGGGGGGGGEGGKPMPGGGLHSTSYVTHVRMNELRVVCPHLTPA